MKLVIFGLSISSSWGNGHATLWRGLCRALIGRGHDVYFFERDVPYYAANRDLLEMPGLGPVQPVGAEAPYFGAGIKSALADKTVSPTDIDAACGRILTQMEKLGMLDGHRVPAPDAVSLPPR